MATHTGMGSGEFDQIVSDGVATAKYPVAWRIYRKIGVMLGHDSE